MNDFMELEIKKTFDNDDQFEKGVMALNNALLNLANRNEEYYSAEDDEREFDIEMEYVADEGEIIIELGNEEFQRNSTSLRLSSDKSPDGAKLSE